VQLRTGPTDAIDATDRDGFTWRLYLDASTHRPVMLSWMAAPLGVFATTSRSVADAHRGTPPRPAQALVEWRTTIGEYQPTHGLTWPRRWTTTFDGQRYDDLRLRSVTINPRIDEKRFEPSR
jgi:hypothetical protein